VQITKTKEFWTPERVAKLFKSGRMFFKAVTGLEPYQWQVDFIEHEGEFETVRVSRQGGKSLTTAVKVVREAIIHPNQFIVIVSPTKEQSSIIFRTIARILEDMNLKWPGLLKRFLATRCQLANGSWIYVTSRTAVRGHTITRLVVDEAAYVEDEVYTAARPSLAASKGKITLISTTFGKQGYFFDSHSNLEHFFRVHIPWTDIPHLDEEFIRSEQATMTEAEFAQEYLAEFIETADNFFTRDEIRSLLGDTTALGSNPHENLLDHDKYDYYLGVDLARFGTDESCYVVTKSPKAGDEPIEIVHVEGTAKKPVTDVIGRIKAMNDAYAFTSIYIDESVIGGAVVDRLTIDEGLPIVPIMFGSKAVTTTNDSKKEAMYKNLKWLLEQNVQAQQEGGVPSLQGYSHQKLLNQLTSLMYEFSTSGTLKVHHPTNGHDDYPDALALALYFSVGKRYTPLTTSIQGRRAKETQQKSHNEKIKEVQQMSFEDRLKHMRKIT